MGGLVWWGVAHGFREKCGLESVSFDSSVTPLMAVTKIPNRDNLKEKRPIWAHRLEGMIHHGGREFHPWRQKPTWGLLWLPPCWQMRENQRAETSPGSEAHS